MLSLNIEFNDFNDLIAFVQALQTGSSILSKQTKAEEQAVAEPAKSEERVVVQVQGTAQEQKRRSRKTTPEAVGVAEVQAPPSPPNTGKAEVTEADVQEVFKSVFDDKGISIARDLLSRYGAKRLGEVKPERYAEFFEHAKRVLAGEAV